MAYRLHRLSQTVRVRPSVGASTWSRTSTLDLATQVLALSVQNSHDHIVFQLHQVSAISREWTILPLHTFQAASNRIDHDHDRDGNHYRIEPGQTKTFFLRLMPREDEPSESTLGTSLIFVRIRSFVAHLLLISYAG